MDPMQGENVPDHPRRNLDKFNIFDGIDDDESLINSSGSVSELNSSFSSRNDTPPPETTDTSTMGGIQIKSEFIDETPATAPAPTHKFFISNMDCWMLLGGIPLLSKSQRTELQDRFPPIFKWLVETCAQTLGVKWSIVYEQLLAIEVMFCMGLEDLDKVENCVYFNYMNPIKDFQALINTYREIW